jgi:hypothetical protein
MRVISGILFFVLFAFLGAIFAGPLGDWLIALPKFDSPDQHAYFDTVVRIGVTVATGIIGAFIGVLVARRLRGHFIRRES